MAEEKPRWKKEEIKILKQLVIEGKSINLISEDLNRSYYSVAHKLNRIGLKHPHLSPSFEPVISPEMAYVLGAWLGDRTSPKKLGIFVKDEDFAKKFHSCLIKILGINIKIKKYQGRFFVQRIDKKFEKWIQKNTPSDIKYFIISGGDKSISSFLRGFFDAEGTVMKRYAQVNQKDKEILEICKILLNKIGITSYLFRVRIRKDFFYVLRIEKLSSLIRFYNNVGFNIRRKQTKLKKVIQNKANLQYKYLISYLKFKELSKNKKTSDIAMELNISLATVYNWINGRKPILVKDHINKKDMLNFEFENEEV